MNISVLGCGRWGSCIAWYLDKIGHNVLSCGLADAPEFIQLKETHKNDYLTFPKSIEVSSDLEYAIERAEVIIISISSQYLRSYFADISKYNLDGKTIVLCMKGVEATTGKRLSEVVGEFVIEVAQEFVDDVRRIVAHIELVRIREEIALQPVFAAVGDLLQEVIGKFVARRGIGQILIGADAVSFEQAEDILALVALGNGDLDDRTVGAGLDHVADEGVIVVAAVQRIGAGLDGLFRVGGPAVEFEQGLIAHEALAFELSGDLRDRRAVGDGDHVGDGLQDAFLDVVQHVPFTSSRLQPATVWDSRRG